MVWRNKICPPHLGSIIASQMLRFIVMDLSLVAETDLSLEEQNMYVPRMEYKYISHKEGRK